ncbi:MAG: hypothetical protein ACI4XR_05415 [Bacilli bacterium]
MNDWLIEDIVMRPNHKFIYCEQTLRSKYLKYLTNKYSYTKDIVRPEAVYIQDNGLKTCQNEKCDVSVLSSFNSRYFEFTLIYAIIDKLCKELSEEDLLKVTPEILRPINCNSSYIFKSLDELKIELLKTKKIYQNEYDYYISTGQMNDFINDLKIFMIIVDIVIQKIKCVLPNIDNFQIFIDKICDYSFIYTEVINFYIGARSNSYLNINIGCNNIKDWKTSYDINGNIIQSIHDYDYVDLNKLMRKK